MNDPSLEIIFPPGHELHDRIFYDYHEGKYYDRYCDWYISLEDAKEFGIPT